MTTKTVWTETEGDAPHGFTEVSRDDFYRAIGPINVHPRSEREASYWETPNRELIGKTTPGYMCTGRKAYFLRADLTPPRKRQITGRSALRVDDATRPE